MKNYQLVMVYMQLKSTMQILTEIINFGFFKAFYLLSTRVIPI